MAVSKETWQPENDKEKIEYIFSEYKNLMFGKIFNIVKDRALAETALIKSFRQIQKHIRKIDDPLSSRAASFVVTVAKTCALSALRIKTRDSGDADRDSGYDSHDIETALYEISAAEIITFVNKLGGVNKNIFLLKHAFGLSLSDIAEMLGDSAANVAARLQKAQRRLGALIMRGGT